MSNLSQWIDIFLVFGVPAFLWKSSAGQMATVAALYGLPTLLIGPSFGALLDRGDALHWMRRAVLLRIAVALCLAYTTGFEGFCALVVVSSLAKLMYGSSATVLTNQLVAPELRLRYMASLGTFDHLSRVATPWLVAFLARWVPLQAFFIVSAVVTAGCWWLLRSLSAPPGPAPVPDRPHRAGFAGLHALARLPSALRTSACLSVGIAFAMALYDTHLPAYLLARGFDATLFSLVLGATAVGAVAATLLVRTCRADCPPVKLMRQGAAVFCLSVVVAALLATGWPDRLGRTSFLLLWCLNGFGYELFSIGAGVTLQNLCPLALLGRVSTSLRSLQLAALMLGPGMGAWLIDAHGRAMPFVAAAGVTVVLLLAVTIGARKQA